MVRAMCAVYLQDKNVSDNLMLMCFNEAIDLLAKKVRWYGHVLRWESEFVVARQGK